MCQVFLWFVESPQLQSYRQWHTPLYDTPFPDTPCPLQNRRQRIRPTQGKFF